MEIGVTRFGAMLAMLTFQLVRPVAGDTPDRTVLAAFSSSQTDPVVGASESL
jgi:hypothetical protein